MLLKDGKKRAIVEAGKYIVEKRWNKMSYSKEYKWRIINYILEKISNDDPKFVGKVIKSFDTSDTTVRRYLDELCSDDIIVKNNKAKCGYALKKEEKHELYDNVNLEEDVIFRNDFFPYLKDLPENVQHIWTYAFTEILNNAIEHSKSETIYISMEKDYLTTKMWILDRGIGIFNNIVQYMKEKYSRDDINIEDAVVELFKGKLTTAKESHSGEGIFFTSRMMDSFYILSSNTFFSHDNILDYTVKEFINKGPSDVLSTGVNCGTVVFLQMSNYSKKTAKEVFDMFAPMDIGFVKTSIPIKHACCEFGYPVSRSQARRLCTRFDEFEEVILDFDGVDNIGQAFAHEIFNVFQRNHPNLKLIVENAVPYVENMIKRVQK
ncbi:MAG: DUF4325 domain-containing protein [Acetatifactor sp.]|nr:DUF4325 domain-containing protein [Acetatifactor sp.]